MWYVCVCVWLYFKEEREHESVYMYVCCKTNKLLIRNTTISNSECIPQQFDAEFRRFSVERNQQAKFEEFKNLIERLHHLKDVAFLISYIDPSDQDLLPINNDENLRRALINAKPLLRIIIQRKGNKIRFTARVPINIHNVTRLTIFGFVKNNEKCCIKSAGQVFNKNEHFSVQYGGFKWLWNNETP